MRTSTTIILVLFAIAALWMAGAWLIPSAPIIEHIGENGSGKAIIPPHLDEQEIRDKARKADSANRQ